MCACTSVWFETGGSRTSKDDPSDMYYTSGPNVCLCFGFASDRRSRTSKDDPYDTLLSGPNVCLCPGFAGDRKARTDPHTAAVSTSGFGFASHPGDLYDTLGARMCACASILLSPQAPYRYTS